MNPCLSPSFYKLYHFIRPLITHAPFAPAAYTSAILSAVIPLQYNYIPFHMYLQYIFYSSKTPLFLCSSTFLFCHFLLPKTQSVRTYPFLPTVNFLIEKLSQFVKIGILYCLYEHNYAIIMSKKGVKYHAAYYAY